MQRRSHRELICQSGIFKRRGFIVCHIAVSQIKDVIGKKVYSKWTCQFWVCVVRDLTGLPIGRHARRLVGKDFRVSGRNHLHQSTVAHDAPTLLVGIRRVHQIGEQRHNTRCLNVFRAYFSINASLRLVCQVNHDFQVLVPRQCRDIQRFLRHWCDCRQLPQRRRSWRPSSTVTQSRRPQRGRIPLLSVLRTFSADSHET